MLLDVRNLDVAYGKLQVLFDVSLELEAGKILAVLGHNGAGKSTLPKAIYGLVPVRGGTIRLDGKEVTHTPPAEKVRAGMYLVPQGHGVFPGLSVEENLFLGAYALADDRLAKERLGEVYDLFPLLKERRTQKAGSMSGGERRQVSLGMALMTKPQLLFIDEPSIGLSPVLVQEVMRQIKRVSREYGTAVLIIEQNVKPALSVADRVVVLRLGRVALDEPADKLSGNENYWQMF
ncbi:MAG: ABC transporter ATP-binding protein [Parvibaculum sp.]